MFYDDWKMWMVELLGNLLVVERILIKDESMLLEAWTGR